MKRKALAIVLTLLMLISVLPMGAFAASYTDTEGHWAEKAIDQWTEAGVINGMGDNTFAPDDNLTRAQAMTIFSRLLKLTEKADISKLTDVTESDWFYPYVQTGYIYAITKGTSDTEFNPEGSITRQEFFTMFARAVGMVAAAQSNKDFSDLDTMADWAKTEGMVYAMINAGFIGGYPDGTMRPLQNITRAEVCQVLTNAIAAYITDNGTYDLTGKKGIVIVTAPEVTLTGDFGSDPSDVIVSSADGGKLHLASIPKAVHVHFVQPNAIADGAKPGSVATTGNAATNATMNGSKLNNNDRREIGAAPSGGGGGGGGGGQTVTTKFVVKAVVSAPFGKDDNDKTGNSFEVVSNTYSARTALVDVLNDMSANAKADMGIINAVDSAYARVDHQTYNSEFKNGDYRVDTYPVDINGNEVPKGSADTFTVAIKVTSKDGSNVNLADELADYSLDYLEAMSQKITAKFGENSAKAEAMMNLVLTAAPASLFAGDYDIDPEDLDLETHSIDEVLDTLESAETTNIVYFLPGFQYAESISDCFSALADVVKAGVTEDEMVEIFGTAWSADNTTYFSNFFNGYNYAAVTATSGNLIEAKADFSNGTVAFTDAADDVLGMDFTDNDVIMAMINAGFRHDGWIHGVYNFSMGAEVVK